VLDDVAMACTSAWLKSRLAKGIGPKSGHGRTWEELKMFFLCSSCTVSLNWAKASCLIIDSRRSMQGKEPS
jgi:hypothetical protein